MLGKSVYERIEMLHPVIISSWVMLRFGASPASSASMAFGATMSADA